MSNELRVMRVAMCRFVGEADLSRLRLKDMGIIVAIDPDTNLVTVREGYIKRILSLYTGLHDYNEVYWTRLRSTGNTTTLEGLGVDKVNLHIALMDRLVNRNFKIAAYRRITRYRDVFPHIYAQYVKAIPNLAEIIETTQQQLKKEE